MSRSWRQLCILLSPVALLLACALPGRALAVVHPATVLDGPGSDVLEADGAALAPDGTGGVVFRKRVNGVAHVFVVQFAGGHWGSAQQVDGENPFEASQPAIAAGAEGRLLVVWVQPRNVNAKGTTQYALMSASLQPGASGFGQAVMVDPNVGEPYTGDVSAVAPKLAMAPDGNAYVVYRVITDDCGPGDEENPEEPKCRPGTTDKVVEVRVARFDYLLWSSLGAINRALQVAMRNPTPQNAPSIGIDLNGNGVVAWQEPGSDGIAHIWVRRLFGQVLGNVLEASPELIDGHPIPVDADTPAVSVSRYGEARIAYRLEGAPGTSVPTPELYVNAISSALQLNAAKLLGPVQIPGSAQVGLGAPSVAVDSQGRWRMAWSQGGAVEQLAGSERALGVAAAVGTGAGAVQTTISPVGGGTTAWSTGSGSAPAVQVREDYPDGGFQTAQLSGTVPGPVGGPFLGGSGEGDALLTWTKGLPGQAEVMGAFVQAPPAPFDVFAPFRWIRSAQASISWEPAPDAVTGVTYSVYVDGRLRIGGLAGLSARLGSARLGDGVHRVQVLATDPAGQQTMSGAITLMVDDTPPIVRVAWIDQRRGVRVTVVDRASGVDATATAISFGDGAHVRRRARVAHRYRHGGTYTITAVVKDRAGNRAIVHLRVRVA